MIVLVSLIVLLRELLVSTIFLLVHPYIAIHSVLNIYVLVSHIFALRSYAHAYVSATPHMI